MNPTPRSPIPTRLPRPTSDAVAPGSPSRRYIGPVAKLPNPLDTSTVEKLLDDMLLKTASANNSPLTPLIPRSARPYVDGRPKTPLRHPQPVRPGSPGKVPSPESRPRSPKSLAAENQHLIQTLENLQVASTAAYDRLTQLTRDAENQAAEKQHLLAQIAHLTRARDELKERLHVKESLLARVSASIKKATVEFRHVQQQLEVETRRRVNAETQLEVARNRLRVLEASAEMVRSTERNPAHPPVSQPPDTMTRSSHASMPKSPTSKSPSAVGARPSRPPRLSIPGHLPPHHPVSPLHMTALSENGASHIPDYYLNSASSPKPTGPYSASFAGGPTAVASQNGESERLQLRAGLAGAVAELKKLQSIALGDSAAGTGTSTLVPYRNDRRVAQSVAQ